MKNRYAHKDLKKLNAHELMDPEVKHKAYTRVQEWRSDAANADMLAIIEAATIS